MAHAHAAGIVHRDFKSENVMLVPQDDDRPPRAVITDFGLARSSLVQPSEPLTSSGNALLGTLDYMAPEQIEGKPASRQADIYALGVVLFEALTGRLPFEGSSPIARALARLQSEAPHPSSVLPSVEPRMDQMIARCLARDSAARFQEVEQVLDCLSSFQGNHSLGLNVVNRACGVRPVVSAPPRGGLRKKHLLRILAPAVGVLLFCAGWRAGAISSLSKQAAPEREAPQFEQATLSRPAAEPAISAALAASDPALTRPVDEVVPASAASPKRIQRRRAPESFQTPPVSAAASTPPPVPKRDPLAEPH
jgi:serine/threonine protein kinase